MCEERSTFAQPQLHEREARYVVAPSLQVLQCHVSSEVLLGKVNIDRSVQGGKTKTRKVDLNHSVNGFLGRRSSLSVVHSIYFVQSPVRFIFFGADQQQKPYKSLPLRLT